MTRQGKSDLLAPLALILIGGLPAAFGIVGMLATWAEHQHYVLGNALSTIIALIGFLGSAFSGAAGWLVAMQHRWEAKWVWAPAFLIVGVVSGVVMWLIALSGTVIVLRNLEALTKPSAAQ